MKKLTACAVAAAVALPTLVSAQANFENVYAAADTVMGLIMKLIPIVIGAAVLLFLFGILRFVFTGTDDGKKKAKEFMIMGIVALAVMVSVWGLVRFLQSTFNLQNSNQNVPQPPVVPTYR